MKDPEAEREARRRIAELEQYDAGLMEIVRKWRGLLEDLCAGMGSPPTLPTHIDGINAKLAGACVELVRARLNREELENALFDC